MKRYPELIPAPFFTWESIALQLSNRASFILVSGVERILPCMGWPTLLIVTIIIWLQSPHDDSFPRNDSVKLYHQFDSDPQLALPFEADVDRDNILGGLVDGRLS